MSCRFISDFNNDNMAGHTVIRGTHALQQLPQLPSLREKLKEALVEIDRLQGHSQGQQSDQALSSLQKSSALPDSFTRQSVELGSLRLPSNSNLRSSDGGATDSFLPSANAGGGVSATVVRLTREAAEENAAALGKIKEEQRRLQQQKKARQQRVHISP